MAYKFVDESTSDDSYTSIPMKGKFTFIDEAKPKKSNIEKGARIAGQFALGAAENALLPYELGAAHLAQPEAQEVAYRGQVMEDIENLQQRKELGDWNPQDEQHLEHLVNQIKNPEEAKQFVQTADIGIRGLAEKATGQDLHPEGILEKAAQWSGFLKDPKKIASLAKSGITAKDAIKAISPSGTDVMRGLGAGSALEIAEQGNFGPIGTLASAVIGDLSGAGVAGLAKGATKLITSPKKTLAEAAAKFTKSDKQILQKEIIKDFRDAGIQADIGTITDSNLLKWVQSRMSQSGLVGKDLEEFRKATTDQIKQEYKNLADSIGEARFTSNHEAGEVVKQGLKEIRDADLAATRELYNRANTSLSEKSYVAPHKLAKSIENLESQLKPGAVKSTQQTAVLDTLERLKQDIHDSSGKVMFASVKDLINNKIALNDIINYEVQGGTKQLLKGIVGEIDRAIISHGKENPGFAKNYIKANKKFSEHAKTFRNKQVENLLKEGDPGQILNKMNTVYGIRNLDKILGRTPQGKKILEDVKRLKFDQVIGKNLVDSTTQQAKLGTFSKLLEKGKNREVIKELLGSKAFAKLEKLQKNAGRLAEAADKFYNASKSGTVAADAAVLAKSLSDIAHILSGNPWPLMKTAGGILAGRKLSKLLADPEFLKMVEDVIIASEKSSPESLIQSVEMLRPYILQETQQEQPMNE